MNFDEMMKDYLLLLQTATETDEAAGAAYKAGQHKSAAEQYGKASVLYAKAANQLLDMMDLVDGSERSEYQQSVDRLIAVSGQMKELAAKAAKQTENTPGPAARGGTKVNPDSDDEEETFFAPAEEIPEASFESIAGLHEAKQIVADEIINPLLYEDVYRKFHRENRGGLLLFGPPGGGKTMMARAIAAESHMAFFPVRCSDIVGRYFGEAEKRVRALFQAAREAKNAVIFMDEAEALACRRGGNSTVMNRLVPELLSQMDGFERFDGHMIVIFATNRPYDLDPAFLRPGRLATHCYIPLPDYEVRLALLNKQIHARPCADDIDVEKLARETEHFSCADLVNVVEKGCQMPINREILARKQGRMDTDEKLTSADLQAALQRVHPSVETEEIRRLEQWMKQMGISFRNAA